MRRPLALAALLICPASATAAPVTIDFSGTITFLDYADNEATFSDGMSLLGGNVLMAGSITFDTALAPAPSTAAPNLYETGGFGVPGEFISSSFDFALGTHTVTSFAGQTFYDRYQVRDIAGVDLWRVDDIADSFSTTASSFRQQNLEFTVAGPGAVSSGAGNASATVLPDFSVATLIQVFFTDIRFRDGRFTGYRGIATVTDAAFRQTAPPVPVPEPGMLALLGFGVLLAPLARRRLRATA